jgi:hypothetical protein
MDWFAPGKEGAGWKARRLPAGVSVLALLAVLGRVSGFGLTVDGQVYDWDVIGRFVMPGETLSLAVPDSGSPGWAVSAGRLVQVEPHGVNWIAPQEPGLYPIAVTCGTAITTVNAFVKVPFDSLRGGKLNGYRIGRYPKTNPFPSFVVPDGFIEVTEDNIDTRLSPRHTLHEFVSRQPGEFPKYLVLREELLLKLELLAELVKSKGHSCEKLTVFSGFRTPAFQHNRGAGRHSAHTYGGAADIYVDSDGDGRMDDLTGDGLSGSRDSKLLASYVDELEAKHPELVGGCGWYRSTRSFGAFVHTDTRGEAMRWHR